MRMTGAGSGQMGVENLPLELDGVSYHYDSGGAGIDGVGLRCETGSWTAVMGPSGAGKSTLLYCASGLLQPDGGTVSVAGERLSAMSQSALTTLRRDRIGFVFQDYNLVEAFTCVQNVMLSGLFGGKRISQAVAADAMAKVGLEGYGERYPADLSGGQRQRVAIARALATAPAMVFADEPTGALDSKSSKLVMDSFKEATKQRQTILMVTHDPSIAACADRTVFLVDGRIDSVRAHCSAEQLATHLADITPLA